MQLHKAKGIREAAESRQDIERHQAEGKAQNDWQISCYGAAATLEQTNTKTKANTPAPEMQRQQVQQTAARTHLQCWPVAPPQSLPWLGLLGRVVIDPGGLTEPALQVIVTSGVTMNRNYIGSYQVTASAESSCVTPLKVGVS